MNGLWFTWPHQCDGTVVFPEAELKIFMTADSAIRAGRRQKELKEKGLKVDYQEVMRNLEERDKIDSTRDISPLRKAEDAIEVDTSEMSLEQVIERVVSIVIKRNKENAK